MKEEKKGEKGKKKPTAKETGLGIQSMPESERPRERALDLGVRKLTDAELLAILIRMGVQGQSAIEVARSLIGRYQGHLDLLYKDLVDNINPNIPGVGNAKRVTIAAGMELGMRATRRLVDPSLEAEYKQACNSLKIYEYISEQLTGLSEEQMWLITFNSQNIITHSDRMEIRSRSELLEGETVMSQKRNKEDKPISDEVAEDWTQRLSALPHKRVISEGGYQETTADVRVILREALRYRALGIAVVHNHPGGSLQPSGEDDRFTWRLYSACKVVGVNLLDHLIYTDRGYYSYFDHDRLKGE